MKSPLAYRPRSGPLTAASPAAAVAYLGSLLTVAFLYSSPVVLAALLAAAILAGTLAGAGEAVGIATRMGLALAVLIVIVNALVVGRGETVLARFGGWPLLGQLDPTAEAIAEGVALGLRALAAILTCAVYSACVDPDRVLRALRPLARRSALTATLVSRLVPLATTDAARLRDAAALRGPGAAPVGRAPLLRRLLAGSLDRAVDVAATLELRGYALRAPRAKQRRERSRHDRRFYAIALTVLVAALGAKALGAGAFRAYPSTRLELDAPTLALSALLILSGLAPMQRRRRRAIRGRSAKGAGGSSPAGAAEVSRA